LVQPALQVLLLPLPVLLLPLPLALGLPLQGLLLPLLLQQVLHCDVLPLSPGLGTTWALAQLQQLLLSAVLREA
jgi:hypothetical protein